MSVCVSVCYCPCTIYTVLYLLSHHIEHTGRIREQGFFIFPPVYWQFTTGPQNQFICINLSIFLLGHIPPPHSQNLDNLYFGKIQYFLFTCITHLWVIHICTQKIQFIFGFQASLCLFTFVPKRSYFWAGYQLHLLHFTVLHIRLYFKVYYQIHSVHFTFVLRRSYFRAGYQLYLIHFTIVHRRSFLVLIEIISFIYANSTLTAYTISICALNYVLIYSIFIVYYYIIYYTIQHIKLFMYLCIDYVQESQRGRVYIAKR